MQLVRREEHGGSPLPRLADGEADFLRPLAVEADARLVEQQRGDGTQRRDREHEPLALAAGQFPQPGAEPIVESGGGQRLERVLPRNAAHPGDEREQVFDDGRERNAGPLGEIAEPPARLVGVGDDVVPGDRGSPAARTDDTRERAQCGGFPGAVGPDQRDDLSGGDVEGERREGDRLAIRLEQPVERDHEPDPASSGRACIRPERGAREETGVLRLVHREHREGVLGPIEEVGGGAIEKEPESFAAPCQLRQGRPGPVGTIEHPVAVEIVALRMAPFQ